MLSHCLPHKQRIIHRNLRFGVCVLASRASHRLFIMFIPFLLPPANRMSVQRRRSFTDLSISPIQEAGVDDSEDGGCDEFCCADQNHFHHHHHHHHQPTRQSEDSHPSSEVFGTPKSNPQDADKGKGYVLRSVCRSKRLARRKRISRENNSQAGVSSSRGQDENENLNLRNENPKVRSTEGRSEGWKDSLDEITKCFLCWRFSPLIHHSFVKHPPIIS